MTLGLLALAGLLGQAPAPPLTTGGDRLEVRAPTCGVDVFSFLAFIDLLGVELAGTRLHCCDVVEEARWPPAVPAVTLDLSVDPCDANLAVIWLNVDDPARRRGARRGVAITELDATTRPRALALIAAELLRSTEHDATWDREPTAPVASVRAREEPHAPDLPARRAPALEGGGELRGYPAHALVLWGVRTGFSAPVGRRMNLEGDAGVMFGERSYDIGTVLLRAGTLGLSVGPRWSPGGLFTITTGARGEVGWAELRGQSSDATLISDASRSAAVASAGAYAALEGPSRARLRTRLVAQGGTMLRGLVADVGGTSTAGMSGLFWSLGLTVGIAPWN